MKYLVGNWKSNKTLDETRDWFDEFADNYKSDPKVQVVVCVPFPFIIPARIKIEEKQLSQVYLASQDISPYPLGAYTGAVAAVMIKGLVDYVLVGHSERRQYFHETHQEIANKVSLVWEHGMKPILCVDAPYAQTQLAAVDLKDHEEELIVAYEPLEAIGSGVPQKPELVREVIKELRKAVSTQTPVIYGGSTNDLNAVTYLEIEGVDGLLPGGASLKPVIFSKMCGSASQLGK